MSGDRFRAGLYCGDGGGRYATVIDQQSREWMRGGDGIPNEWDVERIARALNLLTEIVSYLEASDPVGAEGWIAEIKEITKVAE
jgi:hypothetical protein